MMGANDMAKDGLLTTLFLMILKFNVSEICSYWINRLQKYTKNPRCAGLPSDFMIIYGTCGNVMQIFVNIAVHKPFFILSGLRDMKSFHEPDDLVLIGLADS